MIWNITKQTDIKITIHQFIYVYIFFSLLLKSCTIFSNLAYYIEDLVVTFTGEAGGWQTSTFSINREFICSTVTWDNRSSLAWIRYKVLQCYSWVIYTYLLLWMQAVIILLLLSHYESKSLIMFRYSILEYY